MSYVLQQKHNTYINYDVNRLANICLDNSAFLYTLGNYSALSFQVLPTLGYYSALGLYSAGKST